MKRLFFLAVGMFVMGCEDYLFVGLLPAIGASLNTSVAVAAQGCAIFGIAYILSLPVCAFLISRRSVRQVLIGALVLSVAGNVLTLLSPNLPTYFLSRFIAGLGGGLFLPLAVAAGAQWVEANFRGRALSLMWSFNIAGAVVGVPSGLWLNDKLGWRATILFLSTISTFALVGILAGRGALSLETPPPSLRDQFRLLANRRVLAIIGVTFLTATGCLGLYAFITQILSGAVTSPEVALSLWSVGGLIGSSAIGYVVDRRGKPKWVMSAILVTLFFVFNAIPAVRGVPYLAWLPFLFWGALGWATVTPQQCRLMETGAGHEAILVALNSSAVSLGSVVGTALGGLALAGGLPAEYLPYGAAVFVLAALLGQWGPKVVSGRLGFIDDITPVVPKTSFRFFEREGEIK